MVTYYRNPKSFVLQPDRRKSDGAIPATDRRGPAPVRVTSEQYAHLRDCLLTRERRRAELSTSVRRIRHALVGFAAFLLALFFASSVTELAFQVWGSTVTIPISAIAAIAPFITTYLIVLVCDQARTKMRLGHECQVLDRELQRFGGETSYSVLGRFGDSCRQDRGLWDDLMAPKLNHILYYLRDGYVVLTLIVAYGWSVWLAGTTYLAKFPEQPHAVTAFLAYLLLSIVVAAASPVVFRKLNKKKKRAMERFLKQVDSGGPEDRS